MSREDRPTLDLTKVRGRRHHVAGLYDDSVPPDEGCGMIGRYFALLKEYGAPVIVRINEAGQWQTRLTGPGFAHRQRALPESSLGKAIGYMLGLWPGLTRFLDDPRIPVDSNVTERGLRGVVLGRKNLYSSRSNRGTAVAALFYSLIESAKLGGVEPKAYLLHATYAALRNPGTVTLPHPLLTS